MELVNVLTGSVQFVINHSEVFSAGAGSFVGSFGGFKVGQWLERRDVKDFDELVTAAVTDAIRKCLDTPRVPSAVAQRRTTKVRRDYDKAQLQKEIDEGRSNSPRAQALRKRLETQGVS